MGNGHFIAVTEPMISLVRALVNALKIIDGNDGG